MSGEPTPPDALWRPLAFLALMLGFGLRLDTTWQRLAGVLLVAGAAGGAAGLWGLAQRHRHGAFVPPGGR